MPRVHGIHNRWSLSTTTGDSGEVGSHSYDACTRRRATAAATASRGARQHRAHSHLPAFKVAAVIAYTGLLFTWLLVAVRTGKGSLRGNLLKLPPSTAPVKASKQHAP